MSQPDLIQLAIELGPALLGIVGVVVGAIVTLIGWLGRLVWASHTKRMSQLTSCVTALTKALEAHQNETANQMKTAEMSIQGLRAELHLSAQKWDHIRVGLMTCEATIKSQENKITEHIRELVKIGSQLEAVFRFMDAPRRASDAK
jgi:chromosome segregation ATPase